MKTLINIFGRVILVGIAGALTIGSSMKAQQVITNPGTVSVGETARLIVNRGADFGVNESVNLFVDGNKVAVLGYNESYDAPLSAGKHVLSIDTDPKVYAEGKAKQVTITSQPGKTYLFTAVWPDPERARLIAD